MENQTMFQVSEITLTYKPNYRPQERPKVTSAKEAYQVFLTSWDRGKLEFVEQFKVMLLSRSSTVLGIYTVSTGGISICTVDLKLVFASALIGCSSRIILAHNHPSGELKPSIQDLQLTTTISSAGKILDIKVLDHLIVTSDGYYSFADEGVL